MIEIRARECRWRTQSVSTRPAAPKSCSGRASMSRRPRRATRRSLTRRGAAPPATPTPARAPLPNRCLPRPARKRAARPTPVGRGGRGGGGEFRRGGLDVVGKAGETILGHAGAGGVGLIACQWARALGINLIGTVSSEEKAKLARDHGAAHTIIYTKEDFVARVNEITGGKKVPVVYDSVGKDTLLKSLDCLQGRGLLALFGNSSGPVDALNTGLLSAKGSLYVTRPTLMGYAAKREELVAAAKELFDHVLAGRIKVAPRQSYALKDAAQAHRDLEGRKTTGSTVLIP